MKVKITFIVLSLMIVFSIKLKAQDCTDNLYAANKLLEMGKAEECINLIRDCSVNSDEKTIQWQAYRLITLAHILLGNKDSTRITAIKMLRINPTYKSEFGTDPTEFTNMLKKLIVIPRFTFGVSLSLGANNTYLSVSKSYVIGDYKKTYKPGRGFDFGTNFNFNLSRVFAVTANLRYASKAYSIGYNYNPWKINIDEKLNYLDIPLQLRGYFFPDNRFRYWISGGVFTGRLLNSINNFSALNIDNGTAYTLNRLSSSERRLKWNNGIIASTGVSYKLKKGMLDMQLSYMYSNKSFVDESKRYHYSEQIFTYFYVDDPMKLTNITFNLGYHFNLFYAVIKK